MKTTLEIPDEVMREIRVKAAREDRKLKDLITELLRKGLANDERKVVRHRVKLPLIESTRTPGLSEDLTPEGLAQILIDEEAEWATQK